MTPQEMSEKIVQCVREKGGTSFVELMRAVGPEAEGDISMEAPPGYNIVWWSGMSETFVDALELARSYIEPTPTSVLVYAIDGGMLGLPIVKQARRYKKPHWVPMVFNLRKTNTSSRSAPQPSRP